MNKSEVENIISPLSSHIAKAISPTGKTDQLIITAVKTSDTATSLKAEVNGKFGFIKVFAQGDMALEAFSRETRALEGFSDAKVPRLLVTAVAERLIVMEFIHGETLQDVLNDDTLEDMAVRLGQWLGDLANLAPRKETGTNWFDYLSHYKSGINREVLEQQSHILKDAKIAHTQLAHNDNALFNFILSTDGAVYGIDFEDARPKPEGWDLVTLTIILFHRFPDRLEDITQSVLHGYVTHAENATLPASFAQTIKTIAIANLLGAD